MNEIVNTGDLADINGTDPEAEVADMAATEEPTGDRMEFHVQMRGYTLADMEDLIVTAAAHQMLGKFSGAKLAKEIEARTAALITERIDEKLSGVAAEIIDQPITPSFGDKNPVTMREFVGLCGREFLTQKVDASGNPSTGGWGSNAAPRIERLVSGLLDQKFRREIEAATNAAIREMRTAMKAEHDRVLAAELARVREAIAKATTA